jgi:hypothetical protein
VVAEGGVAVSRRDREPDSCFTLHAKGKRRSIANNDPMGSPRDRFPRLADIANVHLNLICGPERKLLIDDTLYLPDRCGLWSKNEVGDYERDQEPVVGKAEGNQPVDSSAERKQKGAEREESREELGEPHGIAFSFSRAMPRSIASR